MQKAIMDPEDDFQAIISKKKRKNSKKKGSTFELEIAKKLNERFNTDEFCRSPGSGAFATTHSLPEHIIVAGDLITPRKFRFCVECKRGYETIKIADLLKDSCDLWKFFRQAKKDAKMIGREPIVIWKQNRKDTLCIVNDSIISEDIGIKVNGYRILSLQSLLSKEDYYFFNYN